MDEMKKMMEKMMGEMCSEEKMNMMSSFCEKCFDSFSDEEKKEFFKETFSHQDKKEDAWDMMPKMMMSMMSMTSMLLMRDMMKDSDNKGHGPKGGMKPMMGNPMKMMRQMMGNAPRKQAKEGP